VDNGINFRIKRLIGSLEKARETNTKVFPARRYFVEYSALANSVCGSSESRIGEDVAMFHGQRKGGNSPIFRSIRSSRPVFGLAE